MDQKNRNQKVREWASMVFIIIVGAITISYMILEVVQKAINPNDINITNVFARTRLMERLMKTSMLNAGMVNSTDN